MSRGRRVARKWAVIVVALAAIAMRTETASAASKALIIAIPDLPNLERRLPGIGSDVENMRVAAARLGFSPNQVKVMEGSGATIARIRAAIHGWLSTGLEPDDQVLLYLSGYGGSVAGAPSLFAYDAEISSAGQIKNHLPLSELQQLLMRLRSQSVYLVVDSAFGGSVDAIELRNQRLGAKTAWPKYWRPDTERSVAFEWTAPNLVVLAGGDGRAFGSTSWATERGSLLTLGLREAIEAAHLRQSVVDARWLRMTTQTYLQGLDTGLPVDVGLWGETGLSQRQLPVVLDAGNGPQWNFYLGLAKSGQPLNLTGPPADMFVGDTLSLAFRVPSSGYLNVISVDAEDQAVALFPNQHHRDNRVESGVFELPTSQMAFNIEAQPPTGKTLVVAVLSALPINAYELTNGDRDDSGAVQEVFASLSGTATRAFRVARAKIEAAPQSEGLFEARLYGAALEFYVHPLTATQARD